MRTLHSKPPFRGDPVADYTGIAFFHWGIGSPHRKFSMKNGIHRPLSRPVPLSFEFIEKSKFIRLSTKFTNKPPEFIVPFAGEDINADLP
jgi:hypothetical protein